MKSVTYSRYSGEDFGIDAEDLMRALSEFLLESGFSAQYSRFSEYDQHTLEDLKNAIEQALRSGQLFDEQQLEQLLEKLQAMSPEQMEKLIDRLAQKLVDEGYVNTTGQPSEPQPGNGANGPQGQARFEMTDKSLDFLGFKTLKDLLGSLGKSSFGRHDTRDLATGIETSGSSKTYEFGDMLNLDISETLFSAIRREGAAVPLNLEYADLHVH